MQFLYRRHPEIGMPLELLIKPRGSGLLRSHAQEIGTCITDDAVEVVSVTVMAVTAVTVTVTVPMVTVAGFEWPVPAHAQYFPFPT